MDLLEQIFNTLNMSDEQKQQTVGELEMLVKAKVSSELINLLPENIIAEIKTIQDVESISGQQKIAGYIKQYFKTEQIQQVQRESFGQVILLFLDDIYGKASPENQLKIKEVLIESGVNL
jgi:hypothetical protein